VSASEHQAMNWKICNSKAEKWKYELEKLSRDKGNIKLLIFGAKGGKYWDNTNTKDIQRI